MPTLNWIGKDKIINHDSDVPCYTFDKKYTFNSNESENMIIHGDNLIALKSLLPKYEGMVDCIYIDPPYNTGKKEGYWVYYDNVNDPQFMKWFNQTVGCDDEISRHDKWLCMMYPRLKLLYKLLKNDGIIFISIDDNELFNLKCICDEIFGPNNFISLLSVEINPKGRKNSKFISVSNDYCLIYSKNKKISYFLENIPKDKKDLSLDENGNLVHNSGKRVLVGENSFNNIVTDFNSDKHYSVYYNSSDNNIILKKERTIDEVDNELISNGFVRYYSYSNDKFVENTYSNSKFIELFNEGALDFKNAKIYEKNFSTSIRMKSILNNREYETYINGDVAKYKIDVKTTSAGTELKNIFGTNKTVFDNPKNRNFIELLLSLIDKKDALVLDSFAGSGTTAHAVLNLNNKDGGKRKFIEIEMMDYANSITAERAKRAIFGYGTESKVEGLPGNFSFYELGCPLFIDDTINPEVDINDLRDYIFYSAAKQPVDRSVKYNNKYMLGIKENTSYYFYYEKDKECVLDYEFLSSIDIKTDAYVIFADACTISQEELNEFHISFKKTPRDITRF